ncbi:bifunctional adenosylcobinamide kinase/adenosylcobinamide-phosphate guanylyltransferase [bacterium]|nr:bifunctional adenosylcobinamide kinase/adenosylcobinamide-phosphate guanylyltransferase [bacterium]MBU1433571.1 bifunctional adenosylcobinamide kinase/adenosylcobinamide-phosphate guanylyltransferase [bacterium]MBU1503248.1 bifunctional adenosylcobinamide kinase/adenosylcobinamide-phosphate guanylyltransferase [bacterium]
MQALFIGGIKSGKSKNAENYILAFSKDKPIYLATTEFFDEEMRERIAKHQTQRGKKFITLEEPLNLHKAVQNQEAPILLECVSMWINNMLYHGKNEEEIFAALTAITSTNANIVFVINDVSCSVIGENRLVRDFVDINGRVAQFLAQQCEEVYNTVAGISVRIK